MPDRPEPRIGTPNLIHFPESYDADRIVAGLEDLLNFPHDVLKLLNISFTSDSVNVTFRITDATGKQIFKGDEALQTTVSIPYHKEERVETLEVNQND